MNNQTYKHTFPTHSCANRQGAVKIFEKFIKLNKKLAKMHTEPGKRYFQTNMKEILLRELFALAIESNTYVYILYDSKMPGDCTTPSVSILICVPCVRKMIFIDDRQI